MHSESEAESTGRETAFRETVLIRYTTFAVFSADWEIADYSITVNMKCVRSQKNIGL